MPEFESQHLEQSRGPTYSEEHRHACAVRYVMSLPDKQRRRAYLDAVEKLRGKAAAERLRDGVLKAWKRS